MWAGNIEKGIFKPKNPGKYKGDPTNIVWRSSWEKRVMKYLDENRNVLEWQSEEVVVPYKSPVDNKFHRYFPDFIAKVRNKDGTTRTVMIEVKPEKQTLPPERKKGKRRSTYITEVATYAVNDAKWNAAKEFCLDRGWEFIIMTERHIGR
jgi:TnsA endonuclease N terminal